MNKTVKLLLLGFVMFSALYIGAGVGRGTDCLPNIANSTEEKGTKEARLVGEPMYNLAEISNYRTRYVGDPSKVGSIAQRLPVPDNHFRQQYISMETSQKPYSLTIYYEVASPEIKYEGQWPIITPDSDIETNSRTNALVVFCMIDNLDEVTFAYRTSESNGELDTSKYDTSFTFPRASFAENYGDLFMLGENLDLLQDTLRGMSESNKVAKIVTINIF